jgi:2-dehydropantoate 2-reductase
MADGRARPLIWGAGAIGGTVAAYLARAGHAPVCVDVAEDHVDAINRDGLTISGPVDAFTVRVEAYTPDTIQGQFSQAMLCVKGHHTEGAIRQLAPHLAEDGHVVSRQNGLNELTIAKTVGRERTIGAFINFSADYHEPGLILYGSRGSVVVGELDGANTPRVQALHELLLTFDDRAILSDSVFGYLWGKLIYSGFLKTIALGHESIVDGLENRATRDLFVALAREMLAVADTQGIRPQGFDGFVPDAMRAGADVRERDASFTALADFNRGSAKTHSGTWRDLAVRKRKTDTSAQLSPVVALAAENGLATPLTERLIELIGDIEEGRREQGSETLAAFEATRAAL